MKNPPENSPKTPKSSQNRSKIISEEDEHPSKIPANSSQISERAEYFPNFEDELKRPNNKTLEKMKLCNYKKVYDKEYGIYHFQVPSPYLRKASFDCSGETTLFNKIISFEYTKFYKPMPAPGPNDWLMGHKEYGQTYAEFKNYGHHTITKKKKVIYIAPLSFNINQSFDKSFITAIIVICQAYYFDMEINMFLLVLDLLHSLFFLVYHLMMMLKTFFSFSFINF